MKTVWKYVMPCLATFVIKMPIGAEILTLRKQHGEYCLWVLCDPDAALRARTFRLYATGQQFEADAEMVYIGTNMSDSEDAVMHLFEVLE